MLAEEAGLGVEDETAGDGAGERVGVTDGETAGEEAAREGEGAGDGAGEVPGGAFGFRRDNLFFSSSGDAFETESRPMLAGKGASGKEAAGFFAKLVRSESSKRCC
jgi:hypothetical protein